MKITRMLSVTIVFVFLVGLTGQVHAERGDAASQQQELQKALEMMKKQGMDAKTQKQMENMFKNMSEEGAKQQSAKMKKEQQKFEAATAGHGTAQVDVGGKQYELKMIKCEIADRNTGSFSLHARQAPGKDSGELWVVGGGGPSRNNVQFILGKKDSYEVDSNPVFQLNGKDLEWQGTVIRGGNKEALKFRLTCGAEMVDYATPSQPNPRSSVNVLTLQMGQEPHTFQAGYCSTKEYRTGNLIVEFETTATGTFRGRPAIILLSKSHAAKEYGGEYFQNMDLLLGELTSEQRTLSPRKVAEQLRDKVNSFTNREMTAIQKKYEKKISAFQKKFDNEMPALKKKYGTSVPQDKMEELMDPFNKMSAAQSTEMNKVQEQAKGMQYPKARSFGTITVTGQEVHFGGSKLSTQDASRAPEFQNLPEKTELWVTCGE
ncbi:MAG: hypothetical protein ACQ9IQ_06725 [Nitrospirales bacterium]